MVSVSVNFRPDSEQNREVLVLADDLIGVVNTSFERLRALEVSGTTAASAVVAALLNTAFASMAEVGLDVEEDCVHLCREQYRLFREVG